MVSHSLPASQMCILSTPHIILITRIRMEYAHWDADSFYTQAIDGELKLFESRVN